MSPNTANSLVHDLVEMAKAMDILPQVEQERDSLKAKVDGLEQTVQDRELRIVDYKSKIDELLARVRATEAERDDAEMRFLEADDRMLKLERTFQKSLEAADEVDKLIQSFKPLPAQAEPEAQPVTVDVGPGPSEVPPIQTSTNPSTSGTGDGGKSDWQHDKAETSTLPPTQPATSQGQGEVNPTAGYVSGQPPVAAQDIVSEVPATKPSGPYANKRYFDHPTYVPLWDWIDGGGTEESYIWRPAAF